VARKLVLRLVLGGRNFGRVVRGHPVTDNATSSVTGPVPAAGHRVVRMVIVLNAARGPRWNSRPTNRLRTNRLRWLLSNRPFEHGHQNY
jgi:hypothetical protein